MAELALADLQRWFLGAITHPGGVEEGADAADVAARVTASSTLTPEARIGIYAEMYFLRLFEVLEQDFAGLHALLGCDAARGLFRDYLVAHPSRHPNLNQLGARLPAWLAERDGEEPSFDAELARLERSIQESFDAPRADPLSTVDLLGIAPERWGETALPLADSVRLHAFRHPVEAWYRAFRESDGGPDPRPAPEDSWVVVYRRDARVWRKPLDRDAYLVLAGLAEGATLGEALTRLDAEDVLAEAAPKLEGWFRDWAGLGLFRGR